MIKKVSVLFWVITLFVVVGCSHNVEVDRAVTEEAVIEIPPRRSPVTDLFIQNQMNSRRDLAFNLPAFITEDSIYIIANRAATLQRGVFGNDVAVFDHNFVYQRTLHVTDADDMWIVSLDATTDAIYFTIFTSDDREQEQESFDYLYRYDIQASESTLIVEDVTDKLIIDDIVFHRPTSRLSLYALDLINLEREFLLDLQTVEFFIDREHESIIFIGESRGIYQADMTGGHHDLLVEGARTIWSFDGERILYTSYSNPREFWLFDLESNTSFFIGNNLLIDTSGQFEVGFIGDYIFVANGYFIDVFSPNNPDDRRRLLDQDFIFFTVLSDHIIFTTRGHRMHIVDLKGNVERLNLPRS